MLAISPSSLAAWLIPSSALILPALTSFWRFSAFCLTASYRDCVSVYRSLTRDVKSLSACVKGFLTLWNKSISVILLLASPEVKLSLLRDGIISGGGATVGAAVGARLLSGAAGAVVGTLGAVVGCTVGWVLRGAVVGAVVGVADKVLGAASTVGSLRCSFSCSSVAFSSVIKELIWLAKFRYLASWYATSPSGTSFNP